MVLYCYRESARFNRASLRDSEIALRACGSPRVITLQNGFIRIGMIVLALAVIVAKSSKATQSRREKALHRLLGVWIVDGCQILGDGADLITGFAQFDAMQPAGRNVNDPALLTVPQHSIIRTKPLAHAISTLGLESCCIDRP